MYQAIDIANYIIGYSANVLKKPITNLKLQPMLYLIQYFSNLKLNKPFIVDEFEEWRTGPVIKDVYIEFSRYGSLLITDLYNSGYENIYFEKKDKEFLNEAIETLNKYSTSQLHGLVNVANSNINA